MEPESDDSGKIVTTTSSAIVQSESEIAHQLITHTDEVGIASQLLVLVRHLASSSSRLSYFRDLEEAAANGWLLSTRELAQLLGVSPRRLTSYGKYFEDGGFVFTRVGWRHGGEIAWRVSKAELPGN
jgi:hypothetical protein